ncbi:myb domain-containing protein [Heterostelium album PN500]|uniref:Myb domain-containing protein n=1 Tax=Heterostelium pallidum (strain ATCC 26659 / Pp 5 / PN500) TaxID=670386 RepID=D3B571_HETP5|nr:myb domain-containing protein [Heterostelium album PN500]EFA83436.1 myb domain-containing protein [Heterostelium album PN500]|eukprot:XP_020435553.1 myb domain-containing protein [Heterostelium album PN500]
MENNTDQVNGSNNGGGVETTNIAVAPQTVSSVEDANKRQLESNGEVDTTPFKKQKSDDIQQQQQQQAQQINMSGLPPLSAPMSPSRPIPPNQQQQQQQVQQPIVKTVTTPPSAIPIPASIQSNKPVPQLPLNNIGNNNTIATNISKNTTIANNNIITAATTGTGNEMPATSTTTTTTTTTTTSSAALVSPMAVQQQLQQATAAAAASVPHVTSVLLATTQFPIPQCSWFKMNEIHDIERIQMNEFFNGRSPSKTPEIYKEYRDFMINTYQQNPYQYLTLTAVRRNLVGDVCSIMRVHSFLDHWGLINYFVNPDGGGCIPPPPLMNNNNNNIENNNNNNNNNNDSSVLKSPGKQTTSTTTSTSTTSSSSTTTTSSSSSSSSSKSLELRNNIYGQPQAPHKTVCSICGVDCTALRYQLSKPLSPGEGQNNLPAELYKVNICNNCFTGGSYAPNHQATDFTKIEQEVSKEPEEWTDQETLLLLEAIDLYGDSWVDVSEHVATKTKEQCLLHFLRLPIEDSYLEDNFNRAIGLKHNNNNNIQQPNNNHNDNGFGGNEILSMISFLSKSVSPNVASAAAKAAYEELERSKHTDTDDMNIQTASAATLAATSIKAKAITRSEEREIQSLILDIVNLQTKKLEIKLKYYSDLEDSLDRERLLLDRSRQALFAEKLSLLKAYNQIPQPNLLQTVSNNNNNNNSNNINNNNNNNDDINSSTMDTQEELAN